MGFLGGTNRKESAYKCKRHKRPRFDPWVGKIPWRRKWQPIPVFFLGESHGQGIGLKRVGHNLSGLANEITDIIYKLVFHISLSK